MADQAPAPVAPAAPAAPAPAPAPQAPAVPTPTAPEVTPAAPVAPTLTPEEAAAKAEDDGWSEAAKQQYPELAEKDKQEPKDGKPKPEKDGEAKKEGAETPGEKKPDEVAGDGDDAATKGEADTPKDAATIERENRIATRDRIEQTKAVVKDVREKMFSDMRTELTDADGDPIHTIDDVMKLLNPDTGEAFTEEQAAVWLLREQQKFNQQFAKTERQIEEIADLQLSIKAESDYITGKYGDLLKGEKPGELSELGKRLWAKFELTLVRDEKSGVITKMPLSLEEFYEEALEPRMAAQAAAATPAAPVVPGTPADPAAAAQAATEAKEAAERARQQSRADRSDIYAVPPTEGTTDPVEKEWEAAHKAYYGDKIK